jgi:RNA polymerase subunit RPABC4/transcription elongation factor Spt4
MKQENMQEEGEEIKPLKKQDKLDRVVMEKLKGRVIIFNPEESEFAKNLKLVKKGDYVQKAK